jgi:NAD(P)-dependent dehydrogenase (short-subunit alcohol dehydrogenase family)
MEGSGPIRVVVAGGNGALGEAVVDAFVAAGRVCHVPLRGRTAPEPRSGVIWSPGVDLADEAAVSGFFASLPPIRASVHVAGGFAARPFVETSRQDLEAMLRVNLLTSFLCCREAARRLRETDGGAIVNVGSRASEVPSAGAIAYTISKAAVAAMTRALAEELRRDGIRVNAVLPSVIDTPANRAAMPKADADRWPKPSEIARTILWLASAESGLVSGALVPVYGNA